MPRKPNYKFERLERDRAKAKKKAERLRLKTERKDIPGDEGQVADQAGDDAVAGATVETDSPQD